MRDSKERNQKKSCMETHLVKRIGWIRAFILGANDGILSVASVLAGMISGEVGDKTILLSGVAAMVAGAISMATGEYVSVSSQSDIEAADLEKEKQELASNPEFELEELTQIYVKRGLEYDFAREVAVKMMNVDPLGAHLRDELGINEISSASPLQAAFVSAGSFTAGAIFPLLMILLIPKQFMLEGVTIATLFSLMILGAIGAKLSGVSMLKPVVRVSLWGMLSLGVTTLVGKLFLVGV